MAGHGGGAWKVAYADFVTAMMAFFMVMWIVAQNKPVKEAVAQYFRDPSGSSTLPGGSGGGSSVLVPLGTTTKTAEGGVPLANKGKESGGIKKNGKGVGTGSAEPDKDAPEEDIEVRSPSVFVLHEGEKKNTGTVILFAEDSDEIDAKGKRLLDEVTPSLLGKRNKIEVRGHASRRPLPPGGKFKNAWELSYARAVSTMNYLETKGIEPERFRPSMAGGFEPYTQKVDGASLAKNSRVEIYLLNEVVEDFQGGSKRKPTGNGDAAPEPGGKSKADTPTKSASPSAAKTAPASPRQLAATKPPANSTPPPPPTAKKTTAKSTDPQGAAP